MDTLDAILTRKSIRKFTNDPVSDEQVEMLLKAMIAAPSAGNMQPWRIFVIRNPDTKLKIASGTKDQEFVAEAPVIFVVCRVPDESAERHGTRGRNLFSIQDTAAMTQNLLLAAHELGLGGCWVGLFDEAAIATAINNWFVFIITDQYYTLMNINCFIIITNVYFNCMSLFGV